jgi:hypothetical protein
MKKTCFLFVKEIIIIVVCAFLGVAALAVTYLIPQSKMIEHTKESSIIVYNEGRHPHIWETIDETVLDGTTDGLMLNISYTKTDSALRDILLGTWTKIDGNKAMHSLYELLEMDNHDGYEIKTYGRYWHGYQIILKPLLCLFSYADIRQINMAVQLALVILFVYLLTKSGGVQLIFPFFGLYFFLSPITLASAMQYSSCFYVMMMTLIAMFVLRPYLNDERRNYLFLLDGIMVAYFDFLTYPPITVAIPLITYLATDEECRHSVKKSLKDVFFYTVSWGIGYAGMWAMKWVIASLLTDQNVIYDALKTVNRDSGVLDSEYTYWTTLKSNLAICNWKVLLGGFILVIIYLIGRKTIKHESIDRSMLPSAAVIMLVSAYPFIWYYLTQMHSSNHCWFVWRELGISVYGLLTLMFATLRDRVSE